MKKIFLIVFILAIAVNSFAEDWRSHAVQWDSYPCYPTVWFDHDTLGQISNSTTDASYCFASTWDNTYSGGTFVFRSCTTGSEAGLFDWHTQQVVDWQCSDPTPQEPATCSDGIVSGDETGVDCGGSCANECNDLSCPPGYEVLLDNTVSPAEEKCFQIGPQDEYGNCPPGWTPSETWGDGSASAGWCLRTAEPQYVFDQSDPQYSDINSSMATSSTSDNYDTTTTTTSTSSNTSIVTNPDSTTTTTTTSTTTNSADNSTSTTTTTTVRDADNNIVSQTTETETTPDWTEEEENYSPSILPTVPEESSLTDYDSNDVPFEDDIGGLLDTWITSNPISTFINNTQVTTSAPVSTLTLDYKGENIIIDMGKPWMENIYSMIKSFMLGISALLGIFIIFRR